MSSANIVLKPTSRHSATLIFLHGLGDTGHGWCEGFKEIRQPHIKYIFPNAPVQPVTLNAGFRMPSWFDLYSLTPGSSEDETGIKSAAEKLRELIAQEEKLVPTNRIVIGGFSQGGALALYTGLTEEKTLAGLLALSCWLPLHKTFPQALKWRHEIPILQCHGEIDPVVQFQFGKKTSETISSFGAKNLTFKSYANMMHSSSIEEMSDIQQWLKNTLSESK